MRLRQAGCQWTPASFLLLFSFFGEHFLEQGGADVFEAADGLFHRRLVFEGEGALDVTELIRDFSDIDLDILEVLPGLREVSRAFSE